MLFPVDSSRKVRVMHKSVVDWMKKRGEDHEAQHAAAADRGIREHQNKSQSLTESIDSMNSKMLVYNKKGKIKKLQEAKEEAESKIKALVEVKEGRNVFALAKVEVKEAHSRIGRQCLKDAEFLCADCGRSRLEAAFEAAVVKSDEALADRYALKHAIHHLCSAGLIREAKRLLVSFSWLVARARVDRPQRCSEMLHS